MSASATKGNDSSTNSISEIFENLSYGPAPEADNVVQVSNIKIYVLCLAASIKNNIIYL